MDQTSDNYSLRTQTTPLSIDHDYKQDFGDLFGEYEGDSGEFDWNKEFMTYEVDQHSCALRDASPTRSQSTNNSGLVALPSRSVERSSRSSFPIESTTVLTETLAITPANPLDDPPNTSNISLDDFLSNPSDVLKRFSKDGGLRQAMSNNWTQVPDALKIALLKEAEDQENTATNPRYIEVNQDPFQAPEVSQITNLNTYGTLPSINPSYYSASAHQNSRFGEQAYPKINQFQQQQIYRQQAYTKNNYYQQQQTQPALDQAYMYPQNQPQLVLPFRNNLTHSTFVPQTLQFIEPVHLQNKHFQQIPPPRFAHAQNALQELQVPEIVRSTYTQYAPLQQKYRGQKLVPVEKMSLQHSPQQQQWPQFTETQWGKDPRQQHLFQATQPSETDTQRGTKPRINRRTLNIAAAMKKAQGIGYVSLPVTPKSWGPIRADTQQPVFTYTSDGEFSLDLSFTHTEVLHYFQHHPLHASKNPKQSDLLIAVQVVPSDSNDRYANSTLSGKCRFADCPDQRRKIKTGTYRVAFDEISRIEPNLKLDPFKKAAGYVHLYCLEKHFDFPSLCQNYNVIPDTRQYKQEPKPKALSINRDHGTMAGLVADFIANAESWNDSNNQKLDEHQGVPRDDERHWYWKSLCYRLTKEHTTKQSSTAKSTRVERKKENDLSNSVDRHWNNLDEFAAGEERKKETLERIRNRTYTRPSAGPRKRKARKEEEEEGSVLDHQNLDGISKPLNKRSRKA